MWFISLFDPASCTSWTGFNVLQSYVFWCSIFVWNKGFRPTLIWNCQCTLLDANTHKKGKNVSPARRDRGDPIIWPYAVCCLNSSGWSGCLRHSCWPEMSVWSWLSPSFPQSCAHPQVPLLVHPPHSPHRFAHLAPPALKKSQVINLSLSIISIALLI